MASAGSPVSVEIYKDDFRAGDDVIKVLLGEVNDRVFCNVLSLALQLKKVIHNPCGRKRKDRKECGGEDVDEGGGGGGKEQERGVEEGREYGGKERGKLLTKVNFPKLCAYTHIP